MVAVAEPVQAATARRADGRWVAGGVGIVALAAALTLVTGASGPGRTTLALLIALVGGAVWAGAYTLFGARTACWAVLATALLLSTARLPVPHGAPYEWGQALYGTDQVARATVPLDQGAADARALRVLVEAVFPGAEAPYALQTEIAGRATTWACPFAHGRQWLVLPLSPGALDGLAEAPVAFRLGGRPNRENAYLTLFGSYRLPGLYDLSFGEPSSPDGTTATVCRSG